MFVVLALHDKSGPWPWPCGSWPWPRGPPWLHHCQTCYHSICWNSGL